MLIYWHVTLRPTVFKIFTVKWQKPVSALIDPHLETPKDIATKRGEALSANLCHCRRDICSHTDIKNISRFSIRRNA